MNWWAQGQPDESTHEGRSQKARLQAWVELLEREKLMDHVIASYEVVPLLAEYSPRINAQQLKHGLISREERDRVEKLIEEHGKLSAAEPVRGDGAVRRLPRRRAGENGGALPARFSALSPRSAASGSAEFRHGQRQSDRQLEDCGNSRP